MSNQVEINEIEMVYMSNSHVIPSFRITDYYDDIVCELPKHTNSDFELLKAICTSDNEGVRDIVKNIKSCKKISFYR